jgi:hypothetical protein
MSTNWAALFNTFDPWGVLKTDQELNSYYVERENSPLLRMIADFKLSNQHEKALLVGHIGSGKTSSFALLRKKLQDRFFIIQLDAQTELSVFNTGHAEVLILLGLGAYYQAKNRGIKVAKGKYEALVDSLRTIVSEQEDYAGAELSAGQVLNQISSWIKVGFSTALKSKLEIGPVIPDIIDRVNGILEDIEKKAGKQILVTIDGLDKLDIAMAQDVFAQSTLLTKPACHVIYTIPLPLRHETAFSQAINNFRIYDLPNFKISNRNGTPYQPGRDRLAEVVKRRVQVFASGNNPIMTDEAIGCLVANSGGLLRDLIRLSQTACREAMVGETDKIEIQHARTAVQELCNEQSKGLRDIHWKELARVHQIKNITTTTASLSIAGVIKEVALCDQLLSGRHIFSYSDEAGTWFDVHPILLPNIE